MIFNNIVANAVRYRDHWKEDCYLEINIVSTNENATIRFMDNGIGIADEYVDKIFKMFFRASADSKGSGLGLYIVKSAVDKLGGTIEVSSALGKGTMFTMTVPNLRTGSN
jgi:signal transduction histidine kinase